MACVARWRCGDVPGLTGRVLQITLASADFREMMMEQCMKVSAEARERKEQGNQELDKMGLPAAVEARGSMTGIPDSLWHRIRCVQSTVRRSRAIVWDVARVLQYSRAARVAFVFAQGRHGGLAEINARLPELDALMAKVVDYLNQAEGMLAEEELADSQCRSRWGEKYKWCVVAVHWLPPRPSSWLMVSTPL